MKKAFSLVFMFLAFALLMVGCSDSPKTVAKKYVQALSNGDVEEANKYSTSRTHALNGFAASMINLGDNLGEDTSKSSDLKEGLEEIENARVEIDGDVAKIYVVSSGCISLNSTSLYFAVHNSFRCKCHD